jgi:hypothetical protein
MNKKLIPILIVAIAALYFSIVYKDEKISLSNQDVVLGNNINIVFKKYFEKDKEDGVMFPQIDSGVSEEIKDKVNKELKFGNCFPLPDDEDALLNIHKMYVYELSRKAELEFTTSEKEYTAIDKQVEKLSYEETRQRLMEEFYYEDFLTSEVVFNKNNILSVYYNYMMNCGGVHPVSGVVGATFDLLNGELINFKDLFTNYEKDEDAIVGIIAKKLDDEFYTPIENCDSYTKALKDGVIDLVYSNYILTNDGIKLISLNYPYALGQCDINGERFLIPTTLIEKYLKKDGIVSRINK